MLQSVAGLDTLHNKVGLPACVVLCALYFVLCVLCALSQSSLKMQRENLLLFGGPGGSPPGS